MKKEDEQNKSPTKLGTLTLDLVKRSSDQLKNDNSQINDCAESPEFKEAPAQHHVGNFKLNDGMETKVVKPYDLKTLSLSLKEIKKLSDEDLLRLLSGEGHDGHILGRTVQLISNEILIRQVKESSKPHWTAYIGILLALVAAVTGVVQLLK